MKKFVSFLLSFILSISLIPSTVIAENDSSVDNPFSSFDKQWENVVSGNNSSIIQDL